MAFNLAPSANKGKLKMESFLSDDVQLTRGEVNIADLVAWENQPFRGKNAGDDEIHRGKRTYHSHNRASLR